MRAAAAALGASIALGDLAQIVGLGILLVGFLAVGRVRNKDATIRTWRETAEALEARVETLEGDLEGARERGDREHERRVALQEKAAKLEGQIEELRPYGEAFRDVLQRVEHSETVLGTALEQQGTLIMENTAVAAGTAKALEGVASGLSENRGILGDLLQTLGALAERLGAMQDRPPGAV